MNGEQSIPEATPLGKSAVVLFSGGQDSTTCLYWAKRYFEQVFALGFDYGQRHAVELTQAEKIADLANVPMEILNIRGTVGGSALIDIDQDVSGEHFANPALPAAFVPGRNALFLTLAAGYAFNLNVVDLVGGMCETDYSGYPDCRREFVDSMQNALSLALDHQLRIHTPLMRLSKAATWKLARELDILEVVRDLTHTDYNGNRSERHEWGFGRLDNPASVLRAKGYEEAKAKGWV